jgi:hypothetical protein
MQTFNQQHLEATNIGNMAFASLSTDQEGFVLGSTSQGIFIKTSGKWLNFVSAEPFRGPLTITLPETGASLQRITSQTPVRISSRTLNFPDAGVEISTQNSIVWQSPLPFGRPLPESERKERLNSSARKILIAKKETGLTSLIPFLLEFPGSHHPPSQARTSLHRNIILLHERMQRTTRLPTANSVISLLGAGDGLTPSGDDFVIGLLLTLKRWGNVLLPGQDLQKLTKTVVDAAYKKTTLLSANLIECAGLGQADERLIAALDWLMSDISQESSCLDKLSGWGNLSGSDVFVGFVVGLSLQNDLI